jgi:crossover junction endodeoxyribonuclease RuvC
MKKHTGSFVVGIDPGLRATGFAVLESKNGSLESLKLVESGEITSTARQLLGVRLEKIYLELEAVLKRWRPRAMFLEKLYSEALFPTTAITLGHVRGVICLAAQRCGVEILEIPSTEAKKALTGYGRASKEQVGRAICGLLRLSEPPDSEHIADALALAAVGALRKDEGGRMKAEG